MPKKGPILIIEDDIDDQEKLKEVFDDLQIPDTLHFFGTCMGALDYFGNTEVIFQGISTEGISF